MTKVAPREVDGRLAALLTAFAPLFSNNIETELEFLDNEGTDGRWQLKVGGFYKHGSVVIFLNPEQSEDAGHDKFELHGRYGFLDYIDNFEDLIHHNYYEWDKFRGKGFTIHDDWLYYLLDRKLIKEKVTTYYEPAT